jgi:maltose-binding protein MalE
VTGAVVVNGYSEHKELANRFAAYLVNDCAEELYARTGKLAARYNTDEDNGAAQIFKLEYADSVSLPKMIETGNFWLQLEVLFSKVWNGADVETQLQELADQIATQVVAD